MIGAVDVGGTKLAIGISSGRRILARHVIPTAQVRRYSDALGQMLAALRALAGQVGAALDGVGVGLTGRVDPVSGRIGRNDLLKDWEGQDLCADLAHALRVTVAIQNDADAAALAEAAWGAGQGMQRFIYLTVSTGIGGSLILNGRIYRGAGDAHPEIGHHVVDPAGPQCYCGARGCWERLASGTAMLEHVRATVAPADLPPGLDARGICALADGGLDWAVQAVEREGRYLGLGLANLITIFVPDCIALGGGVMHQWERFAPIAAAVIRDRCRLVPAERVRITRAELGEDTALLGAAQAWHYQFAPGG